MVSLNKMSGRLLGVPEGLISAEFSEKGGLFQRYRRLAWSLDEHMEVVLRSQIRDLKC